jgi:CTP synthase (UTP-ammonia lyase)
MPRIGVIGEHDASHPTHVATDDALGHAGAALGVPVEVTWVSTAEEGDAATRLRGHGQPVTAGRQATVERRRRTGRPLGAAAISVAPEAVT